MAPLYGHIADYQENTHEHSYDHERTTTLVGMAGFEPATFCSQSRRAAKLRYIPPPSYIIH
jgi:hypothetical protein